MALFDVDAAKQELLARSIGEIEHATAITWGARAAAAFLLAAEAPNQGSARRWLMDGENYRQEALEHAAMTENFDLLKKISSALETVRTKALEATNQ